MEETSIKSGSRRIEQIINYTSQQSPEKGAKICRLFASIPSIYLFVAIMSDNRPPADAIAEIRRSTSADESERRLADSGIWPEILQELVTVLGPWIRKTVMEELDQRLEEYLSSAKWNSGTGSFPELRDLELRFLHQVSEPVWTGEPIEGRGYRSIQVAIFDAITGEPIKCGPEASAKVEIVILKGDFGGHNWRPEKFSQKIVRQRKGKKLLKGNAFLKLTEGIGSIGNLSIAHNKDWMQVQKLRLGARVADNLHGIRVKEAKTEPFTVKDKRMTFSGKHQEPSLFDEVWRLKNIGKRGPVACHLRDENINNVKDFLIQYFLYPMKLQRILGSGWTSKKLEATVNHALTRRLEERYLPPHPNSQLNLGVVFTEVYQVLGLVSGSDYSRYDQLSETLKAYARKSVASAFENKEEGDPWDESFLLRSSHLPNVLPPLDSSEPEGPNQNIGTSGMSCYAKPSTSYEPMVSLINASKGPSSMMSEYVGTEAVAGAAFLSGGNEDPSTSFQKIIPSISSYGAISFTNNGYDHMEPGPSYSHINWPNYTDILDRPDITLDYTFWSFGENEPMQSLNNNNIHILPAMNYNAGSYAGQHNGFNEVFPISVQPVILNMAKRRWRKICSVSRWCFGVRI